MRAIERRVGSLIIASTVRVFTHCLELSRTSFSLEKLLLCYCKLFCAISLAGQLASGCWVKRILHFSCLVFLKNTIEYPVYQCGSFQPSTTSECSLTQSLLIPSHPPTAFSRLKTSHGRPAQRETWAQTRSPGKRETRRSRSVGLDKHIK